MYRLYNTLTHISGPALSTLLKYRVFKGKELSARVNEKKGIATQDRPDTTLIWFHAASVGEVQSALIVIKRIAELCPNASILVTTGTVTSAKLIETKLPSNAFHQFYPLDHPVWVRRFLKHWKPDFVLWMESELWPNMLAEIKQNKTPALLLNAHMSDKSYNGWKKLPSIISSMLSTFQVILCQTETDRQRYEDLGALKTSVTDNLKYSADTLPVDKTALEALTTAQAKRPVWLYASTHTPEEKIACDIHKKLKRHIPDLLTIIVPRHPERRSSIKESCETTGLSLCFRGNEHKLPTPQDDIYIADTLGELGLFYYISPIACIGRSLSADGGGGHNPIEAAQHNCAILHGPNVQNLQEIFDEMHKADAALQCSDTEELYQNLLSLFNDSEQVQNLQRKATSYANKKNGVVDVVMKEIIPLLDEIGTIENGHKTNC